MPVERVQEYEDCLDCGTIFRLPEVCHILLFFVLPFFFDRKGNELLVRLDFDAFKTLNAL